MAGRTKRAASPRFGMARRRGDRQFKQLDRPLGRHWRDHVIVGRYQDGRILTPTKRETVEAIAHRKGACVDLPVLSSTPSWKRSRTRCGIQPWQGQALAASSRQMAVLKICSCLRRLFERPRVDATAPVEVAGSSSVASDGAVLVLELAQKFRALDLPCRCRG